MLLSLSLSLSLSLITVTEVHGRTFGTWTLLTCTLCYLCAFNLDNKPLYLATFLSFIYAFGHFLTEYLIYQTMSTRNLATVGFFAGMLFSISIHIDSHHLYCMLPFSKLLQICTIGIRQTENLAECAVWLTRGVKQKRTTPSVQY